MAFKRRGGDPVPIAKLLRDFMARRGVPGSLPLAQVKAAYERAAGPELAARSRVVGLKGGVAQIETDTAALAYELHGFKGRDLLKRVQQDPGAAFVTALRFRLGAGSHDR